MRVILDFTLALKTFVAMCTIIFCIVSLSHCIIELDFPKIDSHKRASFSRKCNLYNCKNNLNNYVTKVCSTPFIIANSRQITSAYIMSNTVPTNV